MYRRTGLEERQPGPWLQAKVLSDVPKILEKVSEVVAVIGTSIRLHRTCNGMPPSKPLSMWRERKPEQY